MRFDDNNAQSQFMFSGLDSARRNENGRANASMLSVEDPFLQQQRSSSTYKDDSSYAFASDPFGSPVPASAIKGTRSAMGGFTPHSAVHTPHHTLHANFGTPAGSWSTVTRCAR